ncbi:MAG: UDP-N-acetylglucosamine diphosphorylase/glucosamine-1-phosphate N-acetyltransferase [Gammaproteobacteria bacterium]|nr:UDP-N-acetylglucosamine diphosphorylase/glucosamine-1-phosphate N-acetyltransferase [Gammaproteobacteria bacterium]
MAFTVVILAAGQGNRMKSDIPKVLHPIAGESMLGYVIDAVRQLEPEKINIVHGFKGEQLKDKYNSSDLSWSHQSEQLGTGHALVQAIPSIPDDHEVLVMCGDTPLITYSSLKNIFDKKYEDQVVLLTSLVQDPTNYGRIIRDPSNSIISIVEEQDATDSEKLINEVNTGIMKLPGNKLKVWLNKIDANNNQKEFYLTDVISLAVKDGIAINGVALDDEQEALGINDRFDLAIAERIVQARNASILLDFGATLIDPDRFDLRGELTVGKDVVIDANVIFEGNVVLKDRVEIGPNVIIRDTTLGDDCKVLENSVLDGVIAENNCTIGPFARLRPGVELEEEVKIGNFVEIKKSNISSQSKINHLSYIGDADIGKNVNIGAGTVTCNYDGANKNKTKINDNVFIGSGSMLVAPIEIGDSATVGAGSTITKDVAKNQLTVARGKQIDVKGWKRPKKNK